MASEWPWTYTRGPHTAAETWIMEEKLVAEGEATNPTAAFLRWEGQL